MPIDSKVINGKFVFPDRIENTTLAIHDGLFVPPDQEVEDGAWRTVNASGYLVLPGMIQPSKCGSCSELDLAYQGVTTSVPAFESQNVDELRDSLGKLSTTAQLNFLPCWRLPPDVTNDDVLAARDIGVRVFGIGEGIDVAISDLDFRDCVFRIPIVHPGLTSILGSNRDVTAIVTVSDPDELRHVKRLRSTASLFVEVNLDSIRRAPDFFENGRIATEIDIVTSASAPSACPLIPFLTDQLEGDVESIIADVLQVTAWNPAVAYGLSRRKAPFGLGADADFVVYDPAMADNWNLSSWPGRVIFSQTQGAILLYNDELHILPGSALIEK